MAKVLPSATLTRLAPAKPEKHKAFRIDDLTTGGYSPSAMDTTMEPSGKSVGL